MFALTVRSRRGGLMSEAFKHILLAVDLTEESTQVSEKAAALANAFGATMSCTHVVEPLSLAYGGDVPMDLTTVQDQLHDTAKIQLTRLAATLDVPSERCHLVFGRPETEIHLLAEQIGADLIVLGSHGRHGLALLLGSTSTGVLHGSPCDVLAVRVGDAS